MHEQLLHYSDKLAYEIDSWDVHVAREEGENIVVIDTRSREAFERAYTQCNKHSASRDEY